MSGLIYEKGTKKRSSQLGLNVAGVIIDRAMTMVYLGESHTKILMFPKSLKTVDEEAFYGLECLREVKLNEGLETIGLDSFCKSGLRRLRVPDTVISIGPCAFAECASLREVSFSDSSSLTIIQEEAFRETPIRYFSTPLSSLSIANGVFTDCRELKRLELSEFTEVSDQLWYQRTGMDEVVIMSIEPNDYSSLLHCERLRTVYVGERAQFNLAENVNLSATVIRLPGGQTLLGSRSIWAYRELKLVFLPADTEAIGENWFACSKIEQVTIPKRTRRIAACAFHGCEQLTTVNFQEGSRLQTLEAQCFKNSGVK